eukprot:1140020-Pelagomonas_calceolata.AAC.2
MSRATVFGSAWLWAITPLPHQMASKQTTLTAADTLDRQCTELVACMKAMLIGGNVSAIRFLH